MGKNDRKLVPDEHLEQAKHNEEFARTLFALRSPHCDWVIIACFYAALHYIYHNIAPDSIQNSHSELNSLIRKSFKNKPDIWQFYKKIQNSSENCRYYPHISKTLRNNRKYTEGILNLLEKLKKALSEA